MAEEGKAQIESTFVRREHRTVVLPQLNPNGVQDPVRRYVENRTRLLSFDAFLNRNATTAALEALGKPRAASSLYYRAVEADEKLYAQCSRDWDPADLCDG